VRQCHAVALRRDRTPTMHGPHDDAGEQNEQALAPKGEVKSAACGEEYSRTRTGPRADTGP
jgi:hypothetical protein